MSEAEGTCSIATRAYYTEERGINDLESETMGDTLSHTGSDVVTR